MSYLRSVNIQKVNPEQLGVDKELLDLLYEIAFYGICRSYFRQVDIILKGYFSVNPESERLYIAVALYYISLNDNEAAITILKDNVLRRFPESAPAKAFLGMAYKNLKKNEEAKKVLNEVVNKNKVPEAVTLAKALLEEMKAA